MQFERGPYCKARKRLLLELIRRLALKVGERWDRRFQSIGEMVWSFGQTMDGTTISI